MVDFAVYSNIGSRDVNEDYVSFYTADGKFCFVIADGLGGEGSGDMASRFVCNNTIVLAEKSKKFDRNFLKNCFNTIQKNLMRAKKELFITTGMISTLSILVFDNDLAAWGHIGDSRIYCFECGKLKTITVDHSLAQFMISSGMSSITDIRQHPDRSTLMAAIGMSDMNEAYEIDAFDVKLDKPVSFFMCTDGFWQYVSEHEAESVVMKDLSAEKSLNKLVAIAQRNSANEERDNISAIYIKFSPDN